MTTYKDTESELEKILTELENEVAHDVTSRVLHHRSGKSPKSSHAKALRAIKAHIAENEKRMEVNGETSDGYHTFNELYAYREAYNAALFNEWAIHYPEYLVHKSWKHSDGEDCFGGGWFIVMAQLPTGQISNHYEAKHWDDFQIPEMSLAAPYDGHTPQEALERLQKLTTHRKETTQ